jgi:hypothetical protein
MTFALQCLCWGIAYALFHILTDGLTWQARIAMALLAGLLAYGVKVMG